MNQAKYIWWDGQFITAKKAQVGFLSHALHYGSAVFEGIRAYETPDGAAIFHLEDHISRLFFSAAAIGIKIPYSKSVLQNAACELVRRNKFRECYIRPLVFYGEGQMALFPRNAKVHVAIAAWPWPAYLGEHKALSVCISPFIRFHPKSVAAGAKISGLYATSVMATLDARSRGFNECIMLDYEGNVAEGPGENIFIVRGGKLFTPDSPSILKGITRACVIEIAHGLKIPIVEKKVSVRELLSADEAFFTGTATEIAAIGKIDGRKIGRGAKADKIGPITEQIRKAYLAAVHGSPHTLN